MSNLVFIYKPINLTITADFYSMGKSIVFPYLTLNQFFEEPIIKKLTLFYDHIYIGEGRFDILKDIAKGTMKEETQPQFYENAVWEFLKDNGVVKTYPYFHDKFDEANTEAAEISRHMEEAFKMGRTKGNFPQNPTEEQKAEMKKEYFNHFFLTHDLSIRLDALKLRKLNELEEFYPLLRTHDTLQSQEKKNQVIQFLLRDIPEPNHDVHWDHIIEFRTDEDIKNKYLALLNWVNKVANSDLKLSDIKDEYDYLYSEYKKQFSLHKMNHNYSTLEIVLNATINFVSNLASGNYVSSVKDLFQYKIKNASLLKEEASIPGKEVAYIFHSNSKFGNRS
jgi:hypothetical protein